MLTEKNYQILAPAGSVEQLLAAVNNGCDAVYLGLDTFNARMKAPNFSAENLPYWIDYCHFYGVKVYVTVNTSIKNYEFNAACSALLDAYNSNADGVIVTDLALLQFAAQLPKPFEVVASTQLNIYDSYGAAFVKELGADTVVCARECTFEEIADIVSVGTAVECFLHGALCVCQSGQCLLSSLVGGNSGNRGLCAQPCRKMYFANEGKFVSGGYLLSTSDICGLDVAERLKNLGVTVFKIEGRNRRAEYAGVTSRVYSQFFANDFKIGPNDSHILAEMYNRGEPNYNYTQGKNDGIIYTDTPNHIGIEIGTIWRGKVKTTVELSKGDGLKIFDENKEVSGGVVLSSGSGVIDAQFTAAVRDGMVVRRTTSQALCNDILSVKRKLPVTMKLSAFVGQPAQLTVSCNDALQCLTTVSVVSEFILPQAQKEPTSVEELKEQLRKIGDTRYTIADIVVCADEIFISKSQINSLRRLALQQLDDAVVEQYNAQLHRKQVPIESIDLLTSKLRREHQFSAKDCDSGLSAITSSNENNCFVANESKSNESNVLLVICRTEQEILQAKDADCIIYKPEFVNIESVEVAQKYHCFIDLPSHTDTEFLKSLFNNSGAVGIACHNVGQVQFARQLHLPYIAGTGLNIYNDFMAAQFNDAKYFFYSPELSIAEISLFTNKSGIVFVDGELVLMKLTHCPYKLNFDKSCDRCQAHKTLTYTDELGNTFLIKRRKDSRCTFELVNGRKLSVVHKLKKGGNFCVDFNPHVIAHYKNLNCGIVDGYVESQPYTKGRLFGKIK